MPDAGFLAAIEADPADRTSRLVYADWLDEHHRHQEAAYHRVLARAVRDVGLPELLDSYDWAEVFGEGTGGNCDKSKVDTCPPGTEMDRTPPSRSDVAEVIAAANGEGDGDEWVGVFRLTDGRFLLASGWCDYTGWD